MGARTDVAAAVPARSRFPLFRMAAGTVAHVRHISQTIILSLHLVRALLCLWIVDGGLEEPCAAPLQRCWPGAPGAVQPPPPPGMHPSSAAAPVRWDGCFFRWFPPFLLGMTIRCS